MIVDPKLSGYKFDELNEKLAENGKNIVINNIYDYYANLSQIKTALEKDDIARLYSPLKEPYFKINANSRTIEVPSIFQTNGIGVTKDHYAETICFTIDRYFDTMDLKRTTPYIYWKAPNGEGKDKAFFVDEVAEPDHIVFGWVLDRDKFTKDGKLNFYISFEIEKIDTDEITGEQTKDIIYQLNTLPIDVKINKGLDLNVDKANENFALYKSLIDGANSQYADIELANPTAGLPYDLQPNDGEFTKVTGVRAVNLGKYKAQFNHSEGAELKYYTRRNIVETDTPIDVKIIRDKDVVNQKFVKDIDIVDLRIDDTENASKDGITYITVYVDSKKMDTSVSTNAIEAKRYPYGAKYFALDIPTTADNVDTMYLNGTSLAGEDEDADIRGLKKGHFVFWPKADLMLGELKPDEIAEDDNPGARTFIISNAANPGEATFCKTLVINVVDIRANTVPVDGVVTLDIEKPGAYQICAFPVLNVNNADGVDEEGNSIQIEDAEKIGATVCTSQLVAVNPGKPEININFATKLPNNVYSDLDNLIFATAPERPELKMIASDITLMIPKLEPIGTVGNIVHANYTEYGTLTLHFGENDIPFDFIQNGNTRIRGIKMTPLEVLALVNFVCNTPTDGTVDIAANKKAITLTHALNGEEYVIEDIFKDYVFENKAAKTFTAQELITTNADGTTTAVERGKIVIDDFGTELANAWRGTKTLSTVFADTETEKYESYWQVKSGNSWKNTEKADNPTVVFTSNDGINFTKDYTNKGEEVISDFKAIARVNIKRILNAHTYTFSTDCVDYEMFFDYSEEVTTSNTSTGN